MSWLRWTPARILVLATLAGASPAAADLLVVDGAVRGHLFVPDGHTLVVTPGGSIESRSNPRFPNLLYTAVGAGGRVSVFNQGKISGGIGISGGRGRPLAIRNDGVITSKIGVLLRSAPSTGPPGGGGGVIIMLSPSNSASGLLQSWPGFGNDSGGAVRGPIASAGLSATASSASEHPSRNHLFLSGIGTWTGPIENGGLGTLTLDGLKGVPLEIKQTLRSGRVRGPVFLGPKVGFASGFDRLVVEEVVSYEELFLDTGLAEVGRSLDWAAPTELGPEIFFLAGVAWEEDGVVHDALESFSGASVSQGLADVAFTTDTFLANKLQDYLDQRTDRRVGETARGETSDARWGTFLRGVGSRSERGDQLWVNYGAVAGIDRRLGEGGLLGGFAGYRRTSASQLDAAGSDFRSNDPSAGLYASWAWRLGFQLSGAAWYTYRDYSGARRVALPNGFASSASFDTEGHQLTSFGRASFNWRPLADSALVVTPRFGLQYSRLWVNRYEETGAGPLDLRVGGQEPDSLRTALGLRVAHSVEVGTLRLRPELRGDWYRELLGGASVPVEVESPFFGDFEVETQVPERDFAKLGIGVAATFARCECVEVGLGFDTIVSGDGLDAFDTTLNVGVSF